MPRQGTLGQHGGSQQVSQTALIGARPAAFPIRAQQTARPPAPSQKHNDAPIKIVSSSNDSSSASAPRASVKHETDLTSSDAAGGPDGNVSAIASAPGPLDAKVFLLKKYSAAFQAEYPELVGHSEAGIFVKGLDGKTRRFPRDEGTQLALRPSSIPDMSKMTVDEYNAMVAGIETIGTTFVDQTDTIYDALQECIHENIAGYAVREGAQGPTVQFEVGGKPVSPICEDPLVFALGNGKYMIQQPEFRACSFAAEEMVLAEGLTEQEVIARLRDPLCTLSQIKDSQSPRRNNAALRESMEDRSGCKTMIIEGQDLTSQEVIRNLKEGLAAYGPCVFSVCGHARVLDAIEETADGPLLTVRDPFHASVLKSKPDETFLIYWNKKTPGYLPGTRSSHWVASFLTKEPCEPTKLPERP